MFGSLAYLDWIEGRPSAARHDLGSSDLRAGPASGVVPDRLSDVTDPGGSLTDTLATEYGVDPERVVTTAGASGANFLVAAATLAPPTVREDPETPNPRAPSDERTSSAASATPNARESSGAQESSAPRASGDAEGPQAVVERPGYGPLIAGPRTVGARVGGDARIEPDRIAERATEETRLVTVTNRHNPTGRLASRSELAAAADRLPDGAVLHVDEVYAPYGERVGEGRTAFGGPTGAGLDGVVVTGSLTKFHGLGGLRVGWLIGPPSVAERARRLRPVTSRAGKPSRVLARRFFADRDRLVREARDHCRRNHRQLAEFAERSDLRGTVHDGAPFAALAHERADGTRVSEAAWEEGILVVPGRFFDRPDQFRIALGRSPEACAESLTALGQVLDEL